ncbi:NAD(P)-binding protein [Paenibacillus sp. LMG 31460]|uniref:NAD(P)-binding protein n=2 Tax=Paenibacillus germinis TaxID=2654979 RepID=A0ABX1ZDW6_9BACL|nr:NAD(P)-binding protein [Paenibacillus germinis]
MNKMAVVFDMPTKEAGHHVTVLEASERVGGRIRTIRRPFTEGQYFEAGAMRFPETHYLVNAYIHKFGLPIRAFINETPNDLIYVNGIKTRVHQYERIGLCSSKSSINIHCTTF